ncbi:MAG TPA: DUF3078 domain-containing protein, partial [Flavisolibacter sp.]|nr:DUF3078 domain-containing protein [Flavisolibacter sp.]
MKHFLLSAFMLVTLLAHAQDQSIKRLQTEASRDIKKEEDSLHPIWRKGGIISLNVSQSSLSNWAAGGDNFALSINSVVSLFAFYKKDRHSWDNTFDFNYGYLNTTTNGPRKNDDRVDLLSKYGYALTKKLNLAGLFNFRTQFFKGYEYTDTSRIFTSTFLSPG